MMATALGAAVSDQLDDGRVVSGVGGQYNFVAMAHALPVARSVLLLRATRTGRRGAQSNVVWDYGHTTIPRHLRDVYISEYGIADLRGKTDEDCIVAMAGIADARFQQGLLDTAQRNGKLRRDFVAPSPWRQHAPERLRARLAPLRADGTLPDYPLGSDFTAVEQRLAKALGWLKSETATPRGRLRMLLTALGARADGDAEAMRRMALDAPRGLGERLHARLLALALDRSAGARDPA
jgi:hypothetical protein